MNSKLIESSPRQTPSAQGFTLVELLVAIVVLALLVTFSFSVLSKSAMQTRRVASAATMKNIGLALSSYVMDHGELPGPTHSGNHPYFKPTNKVITYIWPYLGIQKKPEQDALLPEYVPAHVIAWLKAKNYPPEARTYTAVSMAYSGTESFILWGGPGNSPPQVRARWNAMVHLPLGSTVLMSDRFSNDGSEGPKPGELQDYMTRLYMDWHVTVDKIE